MSRVANIQGLKLPTVVYLAVADALVQDGSIRNGWREGGGVGGSYSTFSSLLVLKRSAKMVRMGYGSNNGNYLQSCRTGESFLFS
ncbi:hypothetical protein Hanom_Chr14g01328461 [Helianthus anomalus]